ncbi:MAG: hypothetical protein E6R00_03890, partial [Gammaproteobacteria bacterium]
LNVADLFGCTPASGGFDCSASPFEPGSISWTCAASGSGSLDFLAAYRDGQGGVEGLAGLGSLALIARGDSAADPTAVRENFLVGASVDDDAVVFLQRNAMTGALTFHSRIDNAAGVPLEGARAVVVGGAGKLLFVVSRRSDSLNVFSLSGDATHPLIVTHRASLKNPAIAGLDQALHLVVLPADSDGDGTPDTDHVYVAGANDHAVAAFAYNRAAGTLGHLGSLVNGQGGVLGLADVEYLVASPDGAHVYAISGSDASVTQLLRNRTSGSPDFGKLGFVARFSGSILGASMQGASAAVFEEHGKRMYLTAGDANRVIVLNRVDDPGAGNFGSLSLAYSLGQGEQGARGLLNPRRLQLSQDGQHLYVTSQAGNTLAWFSIHPQTGALAYLGIRSNHSGGIEGLGGATGLVLDPVLDQIYVADTLDGAIAHFQRQSDSWCPASGTGPLGVSDSSGVPVNIAAGGQVVFRLTARVASGLTGNLSNVAHVNWQSANCTGGQGTALTACSLDAEDIDTPSSQADLSITKDDGLAELDGLAGAAALAADVHNLYVAAASDHAIGAFRRETGANGGIGLRQVGFVRSGGAGVSGIAAVSDLVVSADGRNLYAASPVDNAVTSFVREPGNGALSQIDLDQNGLLGVTGLSGARAGALAPWRARLCCRRVLQRGGDLPAPDRGGRGRCRHPELRGHGAGRRGRGQRHRIPARAGGQRRRRAPVRGGRQRFAGGFQAQHHRGQRQLRPPHADEPDVPERHRCHRGHGRTAFARPVGRWHGALGSGQRGRHPGPLPAQSGRRPVGVRPASGCQRGIPDARTGRRHAPAAGLRRAALCRCDRDRRRCGAHARCRRRADPGRVGPQWRRSAQSRAAARGRPGRRDGRGLCR